MTLNDFLNCPIWLFFQPWSDKITNDGAVMFSWFVLAVFVGSVLALMVEGVRCLIR
jgi:hypothetical protein